MKVINIYFMLCLPVLMNAQTDMLNTLKENPYFNLEVFEDSTVKINDTYGNNLSFKNIKENNSIDNLAEPDLIIYLDTVNFSAYEELYRIWSDPLPLINAYYGRIISIDANKNGRKEFYGWKYSGQYETGFFPIGLIFEQDDSTFDSVYQYPDTLHTGFDVGDIEKDNRMDIIIRDTRNQLHFFKQENHYSYVNTPNFIYNPFPHQFQPNNVTFYDIDNDNYLEIVYFLAAGTLDSIWGGSNHVAKYNPAINNYEPIYYHRPQPDYYTNGISIGDFDMDGKGNFGTGSINGKFYVYEHVQGTEYRVEFTKILETYNAYLTVLTDDMDSNGKPEIWIGGDFASSMYGGVTRLFAYESSSPGIYEQVYQIDIRGLFSSIDGRLRYADMDGDGKKDLYLTNANLSFVFKYDGSGDYYMDFVIAAPMWGSIYTIQDLLRIDIGDMDGDGIYDIVPQYFLGKRDRPETWIHRSLILKRNTVVSVNDDENILPSEYSLSQNYPNPFNPVTHIHYQIPKDGKVNLEIYDILGNEIKTLVDDYKTTGRYTIEFDASNLSSGIYIYRIQAGEYSVSRKMTLIK